MQMMTERMGVLLLGVFVSYLLALGLTHSKPTLKAMVGVIGAALGGAPVVFLAGALAKWLYPAGLVLGLLLPRAVSLLRNDSSSSRRSWPEILAIAAVTASIVSLTVLPSLPRPPHVDTQTDFLNPISGVTQYVEYYPLPFARPPHLAIEGVGPAYALTEQRSDRFVIEIRSFGAGRITWTANGTLAPQLPQAPANAR